MKTILYLSLLTLVSASSTAQITTPIVKANFGVDADAASNYFNGAAQPAYDDWFSNGLAGTGQFVIDTTGAAAIVARYTSSPLSRTASFSRLMRQYPYTTVNNRLLIDAIFHRDYHNNDSTIFASGSNKNGMSPALWNCPVAQGIPDKNDILDAFCHVRRAGPNVTDSMWMFSGIAIENTNGSRYFDFELYQTDIYYDRPTRRFLNYGPDAGHTTWKFDAAGNVISPGDIVFTAEFGSSSLSLVEARIWINRASLSITPQSFSWGTQFDGDGTGATFGYASIRPKTTGAFYTGLPSAANTWAGPFQLVREDNSVVTTYTANQFLEFSINLTKLGLDPGQTMHNPCGTPFRRVLIKTRASTSFTSELKDFIAPFRMFDFAKVDANTDIIYYCRVFPPTTISIQNVNPNSVYTWGTTNGHIVGSTTGTSIVVDAPGTYYVNQQLHVQCPLYATDSITMYFDPDCVVLEADFLNLSLTRIDKASSLKWSITNNEEVSGFNVEYSLNGRDFIPAALTVPSSEVKGLANYSFVHTTSYSDAPAIYYRVKAIGKNKRTKYSNIVSLINCDDNSNAVVFPNPTTGVINLSVNNSVKETANICIWNSNGKLITNSIIEINKGRSTIQVQDLAGSSKGIYMVKIKSATKNITKKILLN